MKKFIIASAVAFALAAGAFAPSAGAVTVAELMAQIAALQAQIAGMSGSTGASASAGHMFNSDLTVGATGSEVVALQQFLAGKGFLTMPAGVAMGYFGQLTKTAVAAYQASVGLPATGFFGPMSRAKANASAVVVDPSTGNTNPSTGTTDSGTSLSGGEGQLKNIDTLGEVSSEDVNEGEKDAKVLGVEVEAEDSDISIERVVVDFTHTSGTASDKLYKYVDSVSLWLGSKKLKTLDVDAASEDGDVYSFRFTGIGGVVREGSVAKLYVAVNAVSNVDSNDTDAVWTVEIPVDGIRAVDAAGVSDTYVDSTDNIEETFQVGSNDSGELDITKNSSNPTAGIVTVSDTADTKNVKLLVLDYEAKSGNIKINDLPVGLAASNTSVADSVKSLTLMKGSTVLKSKSIPSTASTYYEVVFDDINLDIDEDETVTLTVVADINDVEGTFGEGDAVYATTTGSSAQYDIEDSQGDSVTTTDSVVGERQTFYLDGVAVTLVSAVSSVTAGNAQASEDDKGNYVITFDVKANGSDVYLDKGVTASSSTASLAPVDITNSDGVVYATTTGSATGTTTSASFSSASNLNQDTANVFYVAKGTSRTFILDVTVTAGVSGYTAVKMSGFKWATTSAMSNPQLYTYNLDNFKTPERYLTAR